MEVLRRLSEHLDGLAAEVLQIEQAIGEDLGDGVSRAAATITRLQRLDFLRQSLEDSALLVLLLSRAERVPEAMQGKLRLDTTRALLACDQRRVPPSFPLRSSGDVDLF